MVSFVMRLSKLVIKGSRLKTIEKEIKEYKQTLKEGRQKTTIFRNFFKDKSPLSNALRNNLEGYIHCNSRT